LTKSTVLTDRFDRALLYATHVHGGQVRKGTSTPYVAHLLAVAAKVLEYGGDEDLAIAALLHDSVEMFAIGSASAWLGLSRPARIVSPIRRKGSPRRMRNSERRPTSRTCKRQTKTFSASRLQTRSTMRARSFVISENRISARKFGHASAYLRKKRYGITAASPTCSVRDYPANCLTSCVKSSKH